ncbi:cytochrome P450 4g1-like [Aricia agestis]|uniref:cytochrome P450 4g1-like n=1 Tax=Aricia agestis TaxID=91739 RepID=UPI001C2092E1|nr:cytochrome P450 4g1-like [Aricia agestis]
MVVVAIILVTAVLLSLLRLRSLRRPHEPPMLPGALPFIGHAHHMPGSTASLWENLQKLGDESLKRMHPFSIKIGTTKVYILSDPDDCYTVAQNFLAKPPVMYEFTKNLLGDGLICNNPPIWQRHRRLMNQMFNQRVLDGFIQLFNSNARELVQRLSAYEGKGDFDSDRCVRETVVKNTIATLTGTTRYNKERRLQIMFEALYVLPEVIIKRVKKIWLYRYDFIFNWSTIGRRQREAIMDVLDVTEMIFNDKKVDLKNKSDGLASSEATDGEQIESFLELLIQKEDKGLSRKEIFDEVNTLVLSSFDTSALGLIYALVRIGSYPDVQQRLYEEIKENSSCNEINDFVISKVNVSKLVYLEAIIKETLRMHTIIPIISRHIDRDIQLKNYTLYKGNECFILVNALHRHSLWGDPLEFRPERWLTPDANFTHLFAPFGIGRRNCIGKVYAMLQMKIQLAHILMKYRVYGDHSKLVHKYELLLEAASGHHISIVKR